MANLEDTDPLKSPNYNLRDDFELQHQMGITLKICSKMLSQLEEVGLEFVRCRKSCTTCGSDLTLTSSSTEEPNYFSDVNLII